MKDMHETAGENLRADGYEKMRRNSAVLSHDRAYLKAAMSFHDRFPSRKPTQMQLSDYIAENPSFLFRDLTYLRGYVTRLYRQGLVTP